MFTLARVEDTIRLDPSVLDYLGPQHSALHQEINRKYANRILPDVGLCVALYDVQRASDGMLQPGDGGVFVKCKFRLLVFSPFDGEILVGWISSCTSEGINVRMEFFDDIHIPKSMLFDGCEFVAKEQAWVWKTSDYELFLDTNEKIRFRVEGRYFKKNGLQIIGSCQVDGMGLISWW